MSRFVLAVALAVMLFVEHPQSEGADIDFNRDVRPILAENCFLCHGPDPGTREGELRLDQEAAAKESAVVPGNSADSKLIHRIVSDDPDTRMPPADSGKQLSAEQIEILREWIDEGAQWAQHWSFRPPVRPPQPPVKDADWIRNPIDRFVAARLEREGWRPSPAADAMTLVRRLSFDLNGLPPPRSYVLRAVENPSDEAYEALVDELLQSHHYGERMAAVWLDAARYADSDGYQADATRQNWAWRDWVIDAYNANMPFDQFTIEQFAGDLLEDATQEQILATCFHRNHMHNGEGGRDPEESRIEYVRDRVNTIGTVWLGLTLECAQCHSHKYDPISQSEYYSLNAFFNSIDESGKAGGGAAPFLKYTSPRVKAGRDDAAAWLEQKRAALETVRNQQLRGFENWLRARMVAIQSVRSNNDGRYTSWVPSPDMDLTAAEGRKAVATDGVLEINGPDPRHDDYVIQIAPPMPRITAMRLTVLPSARAGGRLSLHDDGHIILTNLKTRIQSDARAGVEREVAISETDASYQAAKSGRVYGPVFTVLDDDPRTGWMTTGSSNTEPKTAVFVFEEPLRFEAREKLIVELRQRSLRGHSNLQRFRLEFSSEPISAAAGLGETPLEALAGVAPGAQISADLKSRLQAQFLAERPGVQDAEAAVANAKRRLSQYDAAGKPQNVTVLKEREKPRDTHVLIRGIWNDKGDRVQRTTPAAISFGSFATKNRLELARWLVSRNNPLTARVAVNRYWQMYFGNGLVRTPGDFGTQGEPPTHPELLDWLAVEFMESGWDVKHLQRMIVTSATYRQSSRVTDAVRQRDPENRLLARASRFRLPSWMIRDSALAVADLLPRRIGGPPVFAFQPPGAWLDATMGRFRYQPSVGSDLYRRSLYTFWRRSVGPTGMFDASKRRVCEVRSIRTNTPLHALNLMNDQTFVEASKAVAVRIADQYSSVDERIAAVFAAVLSRQPTVLETDILRQQYAQHVQEFAERTDRAVQLLAIGQSEVTAAQPAEIAALAMVATTVFNLDEAMTHE